MALVSAVLAADWAPAVGAGVYVEFIMLYLFFETEKRNGLLLAGWPVLLNRM
jgi:hypothetical protein